MLTHTDSLELIARYQNANNKEDQREAKRPLKDAYQTRVNDTLQAYFGSESLAPDEWFAQTLRDQLGGKRPSEVLSNSAWQGFFEAVTDFDLEQKREFWPEARKKILLRLDLDLIASYQDENDRFGRNLAALLLMKAYRGNIRKQARQFSPHSTLLNQELVEQAAESGFWEAVEGFDLTRRNQLWTYVGWRVQQRLIEHTAKTMGLSDDGRKVYRIVRETQKRLEKELGRTPTLTLVANEVVVTYPNKQGWSENRLRKAVRNVLEGLNRRQISLDLGDENAEIGTNHASSEEPVTPCLLNQEYLHQRYHQARAALGSEVYAQKFLVVLVLRHLGEYEWPEIAARLTEPPLRIFSVWTAICKHGALSDTIPSDFQEVCESFSKRPPTLTGDALRVWYRGGQKKIREHHFRAFCQGAVEGLGDTDGSKWPILFLLHKGEETDHYWHNMVYQLFWLCKAKETNYTWDEMAPLLSTCSQKVAKPWQRTFNYLFFNPKKPPIPKKWSAVCALFSSPPPNLTPTKLEKWYRQQIETLCQVL